MRSPDTARTHVLGVEPLFLFAVAQTIGLEPILFCASLSPITRYPIATIRASVELAWDGTPNALPIKLYLYI